MIRLAENMIKVQKDVTRFVDYERAFDRLGLEELIDMLTRIGADRIDVRLTGNLYWRREATVKVKDETSKNRKSRARVCDVTRFI